MEVTYLILRDSTIPPQTIKKNANDSCRICLCKEKNLTSLYDVNGHFESMSISEAIIDCFRVRLSPDEELSSFICCECVKKTQDAHTFKCTILKGEKAIGILSQHSQSSDEVVKPFLPILTEDLNACPSGTEVKGDSINCDISPVASSTKITPLKEEAAVNFYLKSTVPLVSMVKDKSNKQFLTIFRKLFKESLNKERPLKKIRNKQNKDTLSSTVLSSSQSNINAKPLRTYTRKRKEENVAPCSENKAPSIEHNYSKPIKEITENGAKVDENGPLAEPKIKKDSNCWSADSTEKWWSKACGPPYLCKLCERNYGTRYSVFYAHVRAHLRKKHPCTICGKKFFTGKLQLHMRSHTNERPYLCAQCPARFTTAGNVRRHLTCHTGEKPYVCELCGKGYTQSSSLQTHMNIHNQSKTCVCEICGITLGYSSYRYHKLKCHKEGNTAVESNERFPCDRCDAVFSKLHSLTRHYKVHNAISYNCKICDATFEEKYSSEVHTFIHEIQSYETDDVDTKPFLCKFCVDVYNTKNDLEQHLLKHVNNPYKCQNCDKSFPTKLRLRAHMQKYCDARPYSCADCGKTYRTFGSLYQHKKCHSGIKKHICDICFRAFLQPHQLMYHTLTHTGEKKYVCQYCGKAFALNGNLTVHVRRHTGETPYLCKLCNKGFYDSSSRKKHMITRHRNEMMADDASNDEINATKTIKCN